MRVLIRPLNIRCEQALKDGLSKPPTLLQRIALKRERVSYVLEGRNAIINLENSKIKTAMVLGMGTGPRLEREVRVFVQKIVFKGTGVRPDEYEVKIL